ncbi:hypothetical protein H5398_04360 [Tessaracoccus sp. MC1679]|uniref:hypothetical protein n=1 Tax=Tessaracoccus sp. MC1679 TaxID=2760313 RepID=UPI001603E1E1|nr:hypothetical protein [Tessaracoccus sp. MC1679]MBB1515211.1 hypothetical protein [Tessaracoccus sp. MC1679]
MSIPAHSWTSPAAGAVVLLVVVGGGAVAGAGVEVLGAGGIVDAAGVGVEVLTGALVSGGSGVVGRLSAGGAVGDSTGADGFMVGVRDAGEAVLIRLEGVGVGSAGVPGGTPQPTSARATISIPATPGRARWWTGPHRSSDRRIVPASLLLPLYSRPVGRSHDAVLRK